MTTTELIGPVVAIETIKFARFADVTGSGKLGVLRFSHEILWVREVTTSMSLWHGKEKVKDCCGYHDIGYFMSCVQSTIEEAKTLGAHYEIDSTSTMRVQIHATVSDHPVLRRPDSGERRIFGRHKYDVPVMKGAIWGGWIIDDGYIDDDSLMVVNRVDWPMLDQKILVDDTVIWSSKLPPAANVMVTHEFVNRWTVPSIL